MPNLVYDMASTLAFGWKESKDTAPNVANTGGQAHDLIDPKQISILDALRELSGTEMATGVEVPQLIVVGDQSTGKSSVLEAIGRFHFPVASRVCTQFPTKLILRRSLEQRTLVTIEPAVSRTEAQKESLKLFREELSKPDEFVAVLNKARAVLGVPATAPRGFDGQGQEPLRFVEDLLVVSSFGPDLAQVDLIDLPGLFTAETLDQDRTGMQVVNNMVRRYVQSQNSLVLLIVSLATSFANQAARAMIQDMSTTDRSLEERVIGVMTNPDRAVSVQEAIEVLEGRLDSTNLRHPWIVVKNQGPSERGCESLDQRDDGEHRFFVDHPEWKHVHGDQRGIGALRSTLKTAFLQHTKAALPSVMADIEDTIERIDSRLAQNVCRSTDQARRIYLYDIARRFANFTREACQGTYQNGTCKEMHKVGKVCRDCTPFFATLCDDSPESLQRNLRARVRLLSRSFAFAMQQYGKTDEIVDVHGGSGVDMDHPASKLLGGDFIATHYTFDSPKPIKREDLHVWLADKVPRWRGREPQGEVSENLYHLLFMYQSEKWVDIASKHLEAVWSAVRTFVAIALRAACPIDEDIRAALYKHLIRPSLKQLEKTSNRALNDLLNCRADGNTGFYDGFVDIDPLRRRTRHLSERLDKSAKAQASSSSKEGGEESAKPGNPLMDEMLNFILKSAGISPWLQVSGILVDQLVRSEVLHQLGSVLSAAFHENEDNRTSSNGAAAMDGSGRAVRGQANFILVPTSMDSIAAVRAIEHVEMFYEISMMSFVGYVNSLVVESGILRELPEALLTPERINCEDAAVIEMVAGERPSDARKRQRDEEDLALLKKVLKTLKGLVA